MTDTDYPLVVTRPSKKARKAFGKYLCELRSTMRLSDWTLHVHWVEDSEAASVSGNPAGANIEPWYGRKQATLTIPITFLKCPPYEQAHTLVHELVHLHVNGHQEQIRTDLTKYMSQDTYDIMYSSFIRQVEYCVDGLADAIAPLVPLPDLPRK